MSLIAASLLVASLSGVGGFLLGKLGSPQSGEVFAEQVQGSTERSGAVEVEEIHVPAWADRFVLTLFPEEPQDVSTYDVVFTHLGNPAWSRTGLRGDSAGGISFDVPSTLPSGVYIVRLYGVEKGTRIPVLQETVDIEWEGRRN